MFLGSGGRPVGLFRLLPSYLQVASEWRAIVLLITGGEVETLMLPGDRALLLVNYRLYDRDWRDQTNC